MKFWLSTAFVNLILRIRISNYIRLGQMIFVFCFTCQPAYIKYLSFYYNWLSFDPSRNLISWMWVKKFIQLGQAVFVVLHYPAYTTYKSFGLIFNHILWFGYMNARIKIHSVWSSSFWFFTLLSTLNIYTTRRTLYYNGLFSKSHKFGVMNIYCKLHSITSSNFSYVVYWTTGFILHIDHCIVIGWFSIPSCKLVPWMRVSSFI